MSFAEFIHINWGLILAVSAIFVTLYSTVQFSRRISLTLMVVTGLIIILAVVDYIEIHLASQETFNIWRAILTAMKYSLTSFILAGVGGTIYRWNVKVRLFTYAPAVILTILCFISIPTGVVFVFDKVNNAFGRGPLGYLPFIFSGLYLAYLILGVVLLGRKTAQDILPIVLIGVFAIFSIMLPLIWSDIFDGWFATTIAVSVLLYSIFLLEQLAKKDPLTGLLNRQSYYHDSIAHSHNVKAMVFIDMNGLKKINDSEGHVAGDEAILQVAQIIGRIAPISDKIYRIGGDEFIILTRETEKEVIEVRIKRVHESLAEKNLSVSAGYCMIETGMSMDEALKQADSMMYQQKRDYYQNAGNRRKEETPEEQG